MIYFSVRLRELREAKHLTQDQLAVRVGVTRSAISAYESDLKFPQPKTIISLAAVLGTTTDYLLCVDAKRMIDISMLTEREAAAVYEMVALFTESKNKESKHMEVV